MSFLQDIKDAKLTGVKKIKLPVAQKNVLPVPQKNILPVPQKVETKWTLLNNNKLKNVNLRVKQFINANYKGKNHKEIAFSNLKFKLKSNKYDRADKLLMLGGLEKRKNIPFVVSFLNEFNNSEIKNGVNALKRLQNIEKQKNLLVSNNTQQQKYIQMSNNTNKQKVNNTQQQKVNNAYITLNNSNKSLNTSTNIVSSITSLLKSQKNNDILKINITVVGKTLKKLNYTIT